MQLEDLERQWKQLDQKVDFSLKFQGDLLRRLVLQPARRRIHRLAVWPSIDIGLSIGVISISGTLFRAYWGDWIVLVAAVIIMAAAVLLMIDSIRQLALVSELDWSGPVAEIQESLERLRLARVRQFKWTILLSPLVGFSLVVAGGSWLCDWLSEGRFNLIEQFPRKWIILNYAFGVLFIPAGLYGARILSQRFRGRHWWQQMLNDVAGHTLIAAREELNQWNRLVGETTDL